MYRVSFKLETKNYEVMAKTLDMSHPYFVTIKDLHFEDQSAIVISPSGNESKKRFEASKFIMIPLQSLALIEEVNDKQKEHNFKVIKPTRKKLKEYPVIINKDS
ncbi:MAG: DUF1820 family protein [Pseudomonadota bacterium]